MRRIVTFNWLTADGYFAEPDWRRPWYEKHNLSSEYCRLTRSRSGNDRDSESSVGAMAISC